MVTILPALAAGVLLFVAYLHLFVKTPRLWGGSDFLNMVRVTRTLFLTGRYGGGKTSFAFILASMLFRDGWVDSIHSNVPSVLCSPTFAPVNRCAFVIDEAHAFIDSAKRAKEAAAYLRKWETYLLMPSVFPPHARLTSLWCQRVFNGYVLGLPLWVYKWSIKQHSVSEKGYFVLVKPDTVFGFYDTRAIPPDDGGLFFALEKTQELELQRMGEHVDNATTNQDTDTADPGNSDALAEISYTLQDATTGFSDAADTIKEAARRISRR